MLVRRTSHLALAAAIMPAVVGAALLAAAPAIAAPAVEIPAPEVGTCSNATYAQAARSTYMAAAVDCTQPHTLEVAATLTVPADVAAGGPNSRELHLWIDARCQVAINEYAGIDDPKTAGPGRRTWMFWHTPTGKEWKAGNHWVACSAGSVPKSYNTMRTKPKLVAVRNSIADAPRRNRPMTFTTDYGTGTLVSRKPMTAMASRPYPGSSGLTKKAWKFCEKTIGSNKYFWYGPSEAEWLAGWTAITCFGTKK